MKISEPLILYTRAGCHLCDQAAALLNRAGISWQPVSIDDDPRLEKKYGMRVPVLRGSDNGRELDYPFDEAAIRAFVSDQAARR